MLAGTFDFVDAKGLANGGGLKDKYTTIQAATSNTRSVMMPL